MASQPQPGSSTRGTTTRGPPPAASVNAPAYRTYVQKCPVLLDWWLEKEKGEDGNIREGGKIRIAGYTTRNRAARVFTSDSITMRHADGTLETADGVTVLIRGPLNITRMHQNGFPYEVSKWFKLGFPVEWEKHANSNTKPTNEHEQSPLKSTEYYIEKFLHGSFINSMGYAFTGNDFNTSKGFIGNTDGPPTQRLSTLSNGTPKIQESTGNTSDNDNSMSKMAAYEELCNASMGMHEESFTNPGETCTNGQADNQHESMHIDASEHEIINHSISCVKQSTGSICSDLKVDGKRLATSEIASFKKGEYGNRVQHGELAAEPCVVPAEECGSGQAEEECGTPKCGNTFVHLGTEDALEVPTKGLSRQFGVVQGSEDNTISRLRNGKVFGMSSGASLKNSYSKRKTMQHEAFNSKMISNEEITHPADLTPRENVNKSLDIQDKVKQPSACKPISPEPRRTRSGHVRQVGSQHQKDAHNVGSSVARIVPADKLQSQDSRQKGIRRPRKKARCH